MTKRNGCDRPLIGITSDIESSGKRGSRGRGLRLLRVEAHYARAVLEAGGMPIMLPLLPRRSDIREILARVDGVLVSGGDFDIDPAHYGETAIPALGRIKEERTDFELELIDLAIERSRPLLGVCGGAQAINVALGGTLYQDIVTQIPATLEHQRGEPPRGNWHMVVIRDDTLLRKIVGRSRLETNTTHHQSVRRLGKGLLANATAQDGVVEGVESRDHRFVLGVQWHPERLVRDTSHKRIYAAFVAACSRSP
jgi:putative glutamine amidotransferase